MLHFAEFPPEDGFTCDEVGQKLRAAVGRYDKTKVYNLTIDDEKVLSAVTRSASNQPSDSDIPDRPQTAVHLLIHDLIRQGAISVKVEEKAVDTRPSKGGGRKRKK